MKLLIECVLYGLLALFFLGNASLDMPNARDKKTGKRRTFYQRWRLASRQLRGQLIVGSAAGIAAVLAALMIVGAIPYPYP